MCTHTEIQTHIATHTHTHTHAHTYTHTCTHIHTHTHTHKYTHTYTYTHAYQLPGQKQFKRNQGLGHPFWFHTLFNKAFYVVPSFTPGEFCLDINYITYYSMIPFLVYTTWPVPITHYCLPFDIIVHVKRRKGSLLSNGPIMSFKYPVMLLSNAKIFPAMSQCSIVPYYISLCSKSSLSCCCLSLKISLFF